MSARSILVLGGSGLLGQALIRRLLSNGCHRVTIIDVRSPAPDILGDYRVQFINHDVVGLNLRTLERVLEDTEAMFYKVGKLGDPSHSSTVEAVWDYLAINALSLQRMMPVLRASQLRTIIVDSSITAVSDFSKTAPIRESDGVGIPTNYYGVSKAILEDICAINHNSSDLKIRVVRYPRVYSPDHGGFLINFARSIANSQPLRLFGNVDKLVDLVHLGDAVETSLRCMCYEGDARIFHAAYGEARTLRQIVELMRMKAGKTNYPIEIFESGTTPREPPNASLADTYSTQELGVIFRHSLDSMIQDALTKAGLVVVAT